MYATRLSVSISESKIATGMPAFEARSTTFTSALRSIGATAMPATCLLIIDSMIAIWRLASVSMAGAFHSTSTSNSCAALTAPACTVCQKM